MKQEWIEWLPVFTQHIYFGVLNKTDYYIKNKELDTITHVIHRPNKNLLTNLEYVKNAYIKHEFYTTKEIMRKYPEMI